MTNKKGKRIKSSPLLFQIGDRYVSVGRDFLGLNGVEVESFSPDPGTYEKFHNVAFPFGPLGRHPGWVISELNGWPTFTPVNCFTCNLAATRT